MRRRHKNVGIHDVCLFDVASNVDSEALEMGQAHEGRLRGRHMKRAVEILPQSKVDRGDGIGKEGEMYGYTLFPAAVP
jgi:hypothetical protein